jgi:hypothetical protein
MAVLVVLMSAFSTPIRIASKKSPGFLKVDGARVGQRETLEVSGLTISPNPSRPLTEARRTMREATRAVTRTPHRCARRRHHGKSGACGCGRSVKNLWRAPMCFRNGALQRSPRKPVHEGSRDPAQCPRAGFSFLANDAPLGTPPGGL